MNKKRIPYISAGIFSHLTGLLFSRILFPFLHSIAEKWGINRTVDKKVAFPYIKKRVYKNFQVITYHRINDDNDPYFTGIPVKIFETQMKTLRKHFNVLSLEDMVYCLKTNDLPPNAVSITFDDGYYDNYSCAYPILRELNLPATIFLATGPLETGVSLWHDKLFYAFRHTAKDRFYFDNTEYPLNTIYNRCSSLNSILNIVRQCPVLERDKIIQMVIFDLEVSEIQERIEKMLSWDDVITMSKGNITFGAHTVTHPILTQLPFEEAVDEIVTSKKIMETRLDTSVKLFAYPNGGKADYNDSLRKAVEDAGFLCAATTLWGNNDIMTGLYELKRIQAWDFDPYIMASRLDWYKLSL